MSLRQGCLRSTMFGFVVALLLTGTGSAQAFTVLENVGGDFVTPTQGRDGRLYWTATGSGAVVVLDPNSGLRRTLHVFDTATGEDPIGGLILGTDGNFYGTTEYGGTSNYGVLYKITPNGTYTVLHNFAGGSDGLYPSAPPMQATDGNLYGTTGRILLTPSGSTAYRYTLSGTFTSLGQIGDTTSPLIEGADGNLYGTSYDGCGSIFELSPSGAFLNGYGFSCGAGGESPWGPVMQAADGNFYGATQNGGAFGYGTVYKLDQSGVISVLYSMTATTFYPDGGLVQGSDGNLYGDAWGNPSTLFQITTSGTFTLLHTLTSVEGADVGAGLLQHTNGKFYGTSELGGSGRGGGTVFSLDMGLQAFISLVKRQGRAGSLAQILGQGLAGSTSVTFNGVPATSYHVASNTFMTAVVPTGATTGSVVVTTPKGSLTSNRNFQIVH